MTRHGTMRAREVRMDELDGLVDGAHRQRIGRLELLRSYNAQLRHNERT